MSREISNELKKLTKADKVIINKMMSYLYTKSINQFELKNMQAEIVGMAAEGALRENLSKQSAVPITRSSVTN